MNEEKLKELLKLVYEVYIKCRSQGFSEKYALAVVLGDIELLNPMDFVNKKFDAEKFK